MQIEIQVWISVKEKKRTNLFEKQRKDFNLVSLIWQVIKATRKMGVSFDI